MHLCHYNPRIISLTPKTVLIKNVKTLVHAKVKIEIGHQSNSYVMTIHGYHYQYLRPMVPCAMVGHFSVSVQIVRQLTLNNDVPV